MELSVASRVKAHKSTPYIDADGRGTQDTYTSDFADCMKSPAEFRKVVEGQGEQEQLLKEMEKKCEATVQNIADFKAKVDGMEHQRVVSRAETAGTLTTELVKKREEQRAVDRDQDALLLDQAYHKRNTGEEAMRKFQRLSLPQLPAMVRDREEEVRSRYQQLKDKARKAREQQVEAIESHKKRSIEGSIRRARELDEKLKLIEEKEAAQQQLRAEEEMKQIRMQREREERERKELQEIKMKEEVELRTYEVAYAATMARERHASEMLLTKERIKAKLAIERSSQKADQDYKRLKELQSEYEEGANEIKDTILKQVGAGSYISVLMDAAKKTAEDKKCTFHGLNLLSNATLRSSCFSPSTLPTYDGVKERTISVQTVISEPIRAGKQRKL